MNNEPAAAKVRAWCLARVSEGYIYGAKGQVCSAAFRAGQAAQYPEQADRILGIGAKWDGRPVWDCAQLTRYAALQAGVSLRSGATSQWQHTPWRQQGQTDTLPQGTVCFLYRQAQGRMQHTGICLGDGSVVHAKGTASGVVHEPLQSHAWTHWAVPYWNISQTAKEANMTDVLYGVRVIGGTLNVRKEKSVQAARAGKLPQGALATVYGEDGDWLYVKATIGQQRICGWVLRTFTEPYRPSEVSQEKAEAAEAAEKAEEANTTENIEIPETSKIVSSEGLPGNGELEIRRHPKEPILCQKNGFPEKITLHLDRATAEALYKTLKNELGG